MPCGCFDRFALFARIYGKIEAFFVGGFPKLLLWSKSRAVGGGKKSADSRGSKRGAVGARVDFLDVNKGGRVGGMGEMLAV